MRGPHLLAAHLVLQRIDDSPPRLVQWREREPRPHAVERLDLVAHERIGPVQLLLELGLGLEIPRHWHSPLALPSPSWQNSVLMSSKAILPGEPDPGGTDTAETIAQQTLAKRGAQYANEVRRLLDAGLDVMRRCGTRSSPRVSDIVAAAGLSNDAFYRHFASKDALVAAIIEHGAARLSGYLHHQMAKASTPEMSVRRWVEGVMSQAADDDIAATTRAVLWNGGRISDRLGSSRPSHAASLAILLREPLAQLGSADPETAATLVAHAAVGVLSDFLWQGVQPTRAEIDHIVEFCLAAVTPRSVTTEQPEPGQASAR